MNRHPFLAINLVLAIVVFSSTHSSVVYAQREKEEPLNLEWVQNDIDGVAMLLKLIPIENQNIGVLKKQLGKVWSVDDDQLGFGGRRVRFGKGYGYSAVYIDVLTFKDKVAYYEIGVTGSFSRWNEYRVQVINAWQKNGGPEFTEKENGLTYQKKYDSVFESYYRAVADELGEMKPVTIPVYLKDAYDYLTSPLNNSYIGEGICGLGGPVLEGKTSIDALIEAHRIDLIENVLRGYNPGGRIFAAITLLRMKREGLKPEPEVMTTLNGVVNLDVPAATCSGCIVNRGRKAKDIVAEFLKGDAQH